MICGGANIKQKKNHPKLKQELATTIMDPNNRGGLQKESPTKTPIS